MSLDKNDIIDERFGRLTVLSYDSAVKASKGYKHMYLCICDCGNEKIIQRHMLLNGKTKSCGCLNKDVLKNKVHKNNRKYKNAKEGDRVLTIWRNMKARCYNKNSKSYKDYGGRGIKICNEWLNFDTFYDWAINNGYNDDLTIERNNVNGDYEPKNCTWITKKEQTRNTRDNIIVEYGGEEIQLTYLLEKLGISNCYNLIYNRVVKRNIAINEAVNDLLVDKH